MTTGPNRAACLARRSESFFANRAPKFGRPGSQGVPLHDRSLEEKQNPATGAQKFHPSPARCWRCLHDPSFFQNGAQKLAAGFRGVLLACSSIAGGGAEIAEIAETPLAMHPLGERATMCLQ